MPFPACALVNHHYIYAVTAFIDYTGARFTRLLVIREVLPRVKVAKWECLCDCGATKIVLGGNLKTTKSCGCLKREVSTAKSTIHGKSGTITYSTWLSMTKRCRNNEPGYENVDVCERWLKFENFLEDMGERPSLEFSIDRIDGTGHYEPGNCRWATAAQQRRNNTQKRLTAEQVRDARARHAAGESMASIARSMGVWPNSIHMIIKRVQWKDIE